MRPYAVASILLFSACLSAATKTVQGNIVDPSGAPVPGAEVSIVTPLGVQRSFVSTNGAFACSLPDGARLTISAPGFAPQTISAEEAASPLTVRLRIAPVVESVRVAGSALDARISEQGSSLALVPRQEIAERNEPIAADLLRVTPGVALAQTGSTGGVSELSIRGGGPKYNLVEIDGVPVNVFGGNFDFAHIPSEALERVEIARGAQSAIYGSYANSGAVNFVTRQPGEQPNLDVVAEGGTYRERRFAVTGGGQVAGFGVEVSASQMNDDGPVANSDYRNQNALVNVARTFGRQSIALSGYFDSSENGVPGPYGSDPANVHPGIDTVSRNKNNFSVYSARYRADLSRRVRLEASGVFFQNNNGFISTWPFAINKDLRANGDARAIVSVSRQYSLAVGVSAGSEQVRNSYITDAGGDTFPVRRRTEAVYAENRFEFGGRLFVNVGARAEFLRTAAIPTDGWARPFSPAQTLAVVNPKIAAAYVLGPTRFHSSFGTGMRPPDGFDLAYTDNPNLKPERTRSFDAGIERRLFRDWLSLDATYFYSRYYDLIVLLGGDLARLSRWESDNIANSKAEGAELTARLRPARWIFVEASYTGMKTEILSLDGAPGTAQPPFYAGQELIRRPAHSGSLLASIRRGRASANLTGVFRGSVLDVEPNYGASNGLFRNPGYSDLGINLNYYLGQGVTAYGNLRNMLNEHYEEVLGYPSLRLNFVAGLKFALPVARRM
jgi:outer membrane receptor protein involved in Fe transport